MNLRITLLQLEVRRQKIRNNNLFLTRDPFEKRGLFIFAADENVFIDPGIYFAFYLRIVTG